MSADQHIHVRTPAVTEDVFAVFNSSHIGSKYFSWGPRDNGAWMKACDVIAGTPNVWVGEVSWLKAAILEGGPEEYVPDPIGRIAELIPGDEFTLCTDELIDQVAKALGLSNSTGYSLSTNREVLGFLWKYKGKELFTVSW